MLFGSLLWLKTLASRRYLCFIGIFAYSVSSKWTSPTNYCTTIVHTQCLNALHLWCGLWLCALNHRYLDTGASTRLLELLHAASVFSICFPACMCKEQSNRLSVCCPQKTRFTVMNSTKLSKSAKHWHMYQCSYLLVTIHKCDKLWFVLWFVLHHVCSSHLLWLLSYALWPHMPKLCIVGYFRGRKLSRTSRICAVPWKLSP